MLGRRMCLCLAARQVSVRCSLWRSPVVAVRICSLAGLAGRPNRGRASGGYRTLVVASITQKALRRDRRVRVRRGGFCTIGDNSYGKAGGTACDGAEAF